MLFGKRYSDFGVGSGLGLWIGVTAGHLSMHHGMGVVIIHIEGTFFAHPQLTASTTNQERNRKPFSVSLGSWPASVGECRQVQAWAS